MRIEATVQEIRALLQLAELDARGRELAPETYRTRREAFRKRVARALLERYEALFEAGRSPVVATIERASCSGCHIRLPTMIEAQARRAAAIHACPHCRRMLYAPDLLAREETPGAGSGKQRAGRTGASASEPS